MYIYIYIYTYSCTHIPTQREAGARAGRTGLVARSLGGNGFLCYKPIPV